MPSSSADYEKRLEPLLARGREAEAHLGDPAVARQPARLKELTREFRRATALRGKLTEYSRAEQELHDAETVLRETQDPEMKELAQAELTDLTARLERIAAELDETLVPRSPDWVKNCIIEIRPAAGGEESALFAGDLFRMYSRYAELHKLKIDVMNSRPSDRKGFKEMVFSVEGAEPYRFFRFESGVHRVQRVPETEAAGRIHTSTVTVAVLPEPEEVEVNIDPADLRVDVFRASGHGGQHVNVTDSAVRITHVPTGIVASCQDERSQGRNKAKAMKVLGARLLEAKREAKQSRAAQERRQQVGTGNRSEKIRTYNFPQNRVTDHRIKFTLHALEATLAGNLDPLFTALEAAEADLNAAG